jgi:hypothetical protein
VHSIDLVPNTRKYKLLYHISIVLHSESLLVQLMNLYLNFLILIIKYQTHIIGNFILIRQILECIRV